MANLSFASKRTKNKPSPNLVGNGINELKINYSKGYRVYFKETEGKIIILLVGGDKSTQQKDIDRAKEIWDKLKK
jgi:putative addiction module killer protein